MSAQVVFCGEVLKANFTVATTPGTTPEIPGTLKIMDPVAALRQIAYYKDRAREDPRRVMAYRKAADVVEALEHAHVLEDPFTFSVYLRVLGASGRSLRLIEIAHAAGTAADLPADLPGAFICSFECTFCTDCADALGILDYAIHLSEIVPPWRDAHLLRRELA